MSDRPIAMFLPSLAGGGAERVALNLLKGIIDRNIPVDLVVADAQGEYSGRVPQGVRTLNLATPRVSLSIPALASYLREHQPVMLLSHMNHANVAAVLARDLARSSTKLAVVEHSTLSASKSKFFRGRFLPLVMRGLYPRADAIVGVSQGVSTDLERQLGLPSGKVKTIYNPVVDRELLANAKMPLEHPWFQAGSPPVFLAVGRLSPEKDYTNLISAFAIVRQQQPARLMILGEGETRQELETAIETLGIGEDVSLPGFVKNPYAYMSKATTFVISSRWEGLPTGLIEAMACGCPVVATDCRSGPAEILEGGKYGVLVPIENAGALAAAMLQSLEAPMSRDGSIERGMYFSTERAVSEYLNLFDYASM
jgi:glycosyltransferase involved in cell wall biosynthesis